MFLWLKSIEIKNNSFFSFFVKNRTLDLELSVGKTVNINTSKSNLKKNFYTFKVFLIKRRSTNLNLIIDVKSEYLLENFKDNYMDYSILISVNKKFLKPINLQNYAQNNSTIESCINLKEENCDVKLMYKMIESSYYAISKRLINNFTRHLAEKSGDFRSIDKKLIDTSKIYKISMQNIKYKDTEKVEIHNFHGNENEFIYRVDENYGTCIPTKAISSINFHFTNDYNFFYNKEYNIVVDTLPDGQYFLEFQMFIDEFRGSYNVSMAIDRPNLLKYVLKNIIKNSGKKSIGSESESNNGSESESNNRTESSDLNNKIFEYNDSNSDLKKSITKFIYKDYNTIIDKQFHSLLKSNLTINFVNELAADQGGPKKDFFNALGLILSKDPRICSYGNFFTVNSLKKSYFIENNIKLFKVEKNDTSDLPDVIFFRILGFYLVSAIINNQNVNIKFSLSFYLSVLGNVTTINDIQNILFQKSLKDIYNDNTNSKYIDDEHIWVLDYIPDFVSFCDCCDKIILNCINENNENNIKKSVNKELLQSLILYTTSYLEHRKPLNIIYEIFQSIFSKKKPEKLFVSKSESLYSFLENYHKNTDFLCKNVKFNKNENKKSNYINFREKTVNCIALMLTISSIDDIPFNLYLNSFFFNGIIPIIKNDIIAILKKWYFNDLNKFKDFLHFVTGSRSVLIGDLLHSKFKIEFSMWPTKSMRLFSAQTCSNNVFVPFLRDIKEYENVLELSIYGTVGFSFA